MLAKIFRRFKDFIFDDEYRGVLSARVRVFVARIFLPELSVIGVQQKDGYILLFAKDNAVTPSVISSGGFQKTTMNQALLLIEKNQLLNRNIFVDIGANIGTSTIQALTENRFQSAILFEPVPQNLSLLRANLASFDLSSKSKVEAFGISNRECASKIFLSTKNCGDNRIDTQPAGDSKIADQSGIPIQLTTLDTYIAANKINPKDIGLFWIDTQGHEQSVIAGAKNTLNASRAPIIFEVWPWALNQRADLKMQTWDFPEDAYKVFYDLGINDFSPRPISTMSAYIKSLSLRADFYTDFLVL